MQPQTPTDALGGGFAKPPIDAAHAFRHIMQAMARPGTVQRIAGAAPPGQLSIAAGAVLLTLCDAETPVYFAGAADTPALRSWLAFHTGAPLTGPSQCMFAVGSWSDLMPLTAYRIGTPDHPDRSATLIVDGAELHPEGSTLTGPGIRRQVTLSVPDVAALQENHARFPLGLDFLLTNGDQLAALPRTTRVTAMQGAA